MRKRRLRGEARHGVDINALRVAMQVLEPDIQTAVGTCVSSNIKSLHSAVPQGSTVVGKIQLWIHFQFLVHEMKGVNCQ